MKNYNDDNWYGTLNVDNIKAVAKTILKKLENNKYTFTSTYEYRSWSPESRVHQELKNGTNKSPLSVWFGKNNEYGGFNFCDSYGVGGVSTSQKEDKYDPNFNSPYVVIDYNEVKITHRAPNGLLCYWLIVIE